MESNKKNQSADHSIDNSDVSKIVIPSPENEKHEDASAEAVRTTFMHSQENSIQNPQKPNLQVTPNTQN